ARRRLHRNERRPVQIRSLSCTAEEIGSRRTDGEEQKSALDVNGHEAPDVGAGMVLPLVILPLLVMWFTGTRDRVKRPDEFPGMDVPGADVALRSVGRLFLQLGAGEDQVLVNRTGRRHTVTSARKVRGYALLQVHDPVVAKRRGELARLSIQREE